MGPDERSQYRLEAIEHYADTFPNAMGSEIMYMARRAVYRQFDHAQGIVWTEGPSPYNARVGQTPGGHPSFVFPLITNPQRPASQRPTPLADRLKDLEDEVAALKAEVSVLREKVGEVRQEGKPSSGKEEQRPYYL